MRCYSLMAAPMSCARDRSSLTPYVSPLSPTYMHARTHSYRYWIVCVCVMYWSRVHVSRLCKFSKPIMCAIHTH